MKQITFNPSKTMAKKNETTKPAPMLYYDIEVSGMTYAAILQAAQFVRACIMGDLSPVVNVALAAYRRRKGEDAPADIEHNIRECARGLAAWGWNKPVEQPAETEAAQIFRDIENVMTTQELILRGEPAPEPMEHHAANVPLPRVRCAYQSTQARVKQLRIFAPTITNHKPR